MVVLDWRYLAFISLSLFSCEMEVDNPVENKKCGIWDLGRVPNESLLTAYDYSNSADGQTSSKQLVIFQSLAALKEYDRGCVEELRWQDYQLGRRTVRARRASNLNAATSGTHLPYRATPGADITTRRGAFVAVDTSFECITAMPDYQRKSFEELRWEDYCAKRKCGASLLLDSVASQRRTLNPDTAGTPIRYAPSASTETTARSEAGSRVVSITEMLEYRDKSFEELRWEDYMLNRRTTRRETSGSNTSRVVEQNAEAATAAGQPNQVQSGGETSSSAKAEDDEPTCPICLLTLKEVNIYKFLIKQQQNFIYFFYKFQQLFEA